MIEARDRPDEHWTPAVIELLSCCAVAASGRRDVLHPARCGGSIDAGVDALARAYASVTGTGERTRAMNVLRAMCEAASSAWPGADAIMLQPCAALSYSLHHKSLCADGPCDWTTRVHGTEDARPLVYRMADDGRTLHWHLRHRVAPDVTQACADLQASLSLDSDASGQPHAVGAHALPRLAVGVLRSWAADVRQYGCARHCLTLPPWHMLDDAQIGSARMTALGKFCAQLMLLCTVTPQHSAATVNYERLHAWCKQWKARADALQHAAARAHGLQMAP